MGRTSVFWTNLDPVLHGNCSLFSCYQEPHVHPVTTTLHIYHCLVGLGNCWSGTRAGHQQTRWFAVDAKAAHLQQTLLLPALLSPTASRRAGGPAKHTWVGCEDACRLHTVVGTCGHPLRVPVHVKHTKPLDISSKLPVSSANSCPSNGL